MPAVAVTHSIVRRVSGKRLVWPTADGKPVNIECEFGFRQLETPEEPDGRPDAHRGLDIPYEEGDTIYSPMSGVCHRSYMTWLRFETIEQLDLLELIDPAGGSSVAHGTNAVAITAARTGAAAFPSGITRYQHITGRMSPKNGEDWMVSIAIDGSFPATGALGVGVFSPNSSERVAMEYDGVTVTLRGVGATTFADDGTTHSVSGALWLRVIYTADTDTISWQTSDDEDGESDTWTDVATHVGPTFASTLTTHIPTIYWRSADTNATPYQLSVREFNYYDADRQTPRFGNAMWLTNGICTVVMQHMQYQRVRQGDVVIQNQVLGLAGHTGGDAYSGNVKHPHVHAEVYLGASKVYNAELTLNILGAGFLPHLNAPDFSVVRTLENSPADDLSHCLTITVQRVGLAYQNFTLNGVSLTGTLSTIDFDMNLRDGLDPSNPDTMPYNGLYIEGHDIDPDATEFVNRYFFDTAVVGTFVSYEVTDTEGVVRASG